LDAVGDIDLSGEDGTSLLEKASEAGSEECFKMLFDNGAQGSIKTLQGAIESSSASIAKKILDAGLDIDFAGKDGSNLLEIAAEAGSDECFKILIDNGAQGSK
jgi:ankyrin repeat protein